MSLRRKRPTRAQQPATSGLGLCFASPHKRFDKHKSKTLVVPIGQDAKRRRLEAELEALLNDTETEDATGDEVSFQSPAFVDNDAPLSPPAPPNTLPDNPNVIPDETSKSRRISPDQASRNLYNKWQEVLQKLVEPFLDFISKSCGKVVQPAEILETTCCEPACARKTGTILCLFQSRKSHS